MWTHADTMWTDADCPQKRRQMWTINADNKCRQHQDQLHDKSNGTVRNTSDQASERDILRLISWRCFPCE